MWYSTGREPIFYRTPDEQPNHYTTDVVYWGLIIAIQKNVSIIGYTFSRNNVNINFIIIAVVGIVMFVQNI
jgi:hypothetical protein